jgi:hypothetical protein
MRPATASDSVRIPAGSPVKHENLLLVSVVSATDWLVFRERDRKVAASLSKCSALLHLQGVDALVTVKCSLCS